MKIEELARIKKRLVTVQDLQWIKRYGADEMIELIYEDVPKLIQEVETLNGNADKEASPKVRSKTGKRSAPGS